jgi:hypothetical protein
MQPKNSIHNLYSFALALILVLTSLGLQPAHAQTQMARAADTQSGIPDDWWSQAQEYIRQSEYHLSWVDEPLIAGAPPSFQAPNRAQNLRFYFQAQGVQIIQRTETQPSWVWGIALAGIGSEDRLAAPQAAGLNVEANRIAYQRGDLVESYTNTEQGLVQNFKVASRPADKNSAQLRLALRISGDLTLRRLANGGLEWLHDGQPTLHYTNLRAVDAQGHDLAVQIASLEAVTTETGQTAYDLQLAIQDQDASYPVEVEAVINGVSPSANWLNLGHQDYAHLGMSVATAGDVNGDGYSDVIIGAPEYDYLSIVDAGMAFVYHGSSNGLLNVYNWSWYGNSNDKFGTTVATAGDVNGDGYSDVIIGAPDWESQVDLEGEGIVYAFYGSAGGLSTMVNWSYHPGDQAHSGLGYAISTAGDVDGDGYSDIIVGVSERKDIANTYGLFDIFYGSPDGLTTAGRSWVWGDQVNSQLGFAVSTAGDVNGDGYSDVLAGAPGYDSGGKTDNGRVYLYYGSASGLNQNEPTILSGGAAGESYEYYGMTVSTAGDVNGDGYSDVIIGVPYRNGTGVLKGYVFVYHGAPSGLNTSIAWYIIGNEDYGRLGNSVATAGDVNSDGYADILIGQAMFDGAGTDQGRALLWLGGGNGLGPFADTISSADWQAVLEFNNSQFGYSLATAGDVNGDGYSDVIVGAPFYSGEHDGEGQVRVFHGGPDNLSNTAGWSNTGQFTDINLGFSVASAGDINGDGYADVIAGAPYYDSSAADQGMVFVWHGSLSGLDPSLANWWAFGGQTDARLGYSVDSAGDVNGDGYDDIIAGAPFFNNGSMDEGMAFVWLGSPSGLGDTGTFSNADWKAESNKINAALGYAVAGAGDVNGDGYSDVAIGAPYYTNNQTNEGKVAVWLGGLSGLGADGSFTNYDWAFESDWTNRYLGLSIAGAGDVNRDGFSDLVAGGLEAAYGWKGSPNGLTKIGSDWLRDDPGHPNSHFGASVDTAGDINGDGYSDVIVGAPWTTGALGSQQGAAYAYCGSVSGFSYSTCWFANGGNQNAQFGASVAGAGDVNGDGYADILVGAPTDTNTEVQKGSAHLYYGAASGPMSNSSGDWQTFSSDTYADLGAAVASAGDVNGDGYADILIGAPGMSSDRGQVQLFYGNGARGKAIKPRQLLTNYQPLARLGKTNMTSFMTQVFIYSPTGRGDCKVELEVKTLQNLFNGAGSFLSPIWADTQVNGMAFYFTDTLLGYGTQYHWRVRFHHSPVTSPFDPPRSRWYHTPWNGWNEADLRTPYVTTYLPLIRK